MNTSKRLDMLKATANLKNIFYEDKKEKNVRYHEKIQSDRKKSYNLDK